VDPNSPLTALAEDLERHLGDPYDPAGPMRYARILELDEREEYPHELVRHLQAWGAQAYGVPASHGGRAVDLQDSLTLVRLVARRDATAATALSISNIAYMPIWVAGTDEQKRTYGTAITDGDTMAWGLSEREHGSDIAANSLTATRVPGGYRLTGEKWLIGNGTVADMVVLHARTAERGGPAGFSLFVLDKRELPRSVIGTVPDEPLHGLRGLDMSGIRLDGCLLPGSRLIGREGQGVEIALQSAHTIRIQITAIALGCADTALRLAMDFATRRTLFGRRVADIPYSRRQLVDAFADLLIGDTVATGAARSLQVSPAQSSVFSAVAKYLVPTTLESTVGQLAVVLGARHYLRAHPRYGPFQKAARDLLVANFADGNTVVNLKSLAVQLPGLLRYGTDAEPADRRAAADRARTIYGPDAPLPPFEPWRLQLASRGMDDAVLGLAPAIDTIRLRAETAAGPDARRLTLLARLGDGFTAELSTLAGDLKDLVGTQPRGWGQSAELFALAQRYCLVHAAAACLHQLLGADELEPAVALLCLDRLWCRLHPTGSVLDVATVDRGMAVLARLYAEHRLFGHRPIRLAGSVPTGGPDETR
jgi:alkylation response protein AidB-like acyl-CoA dehydrogenase